MDADVSPMKVPALIAALKSRGLPSTGLKADLAARLSEARQHAGSGNEEGASPGKTENPWLGTWLTDNLSNPDDALRTLAQNLYFEQYVGAVGAVPGDHTPLVPNGAQKLSINRGKVKDSWTCRSCNVEFEATTRNRLWFTLQQMSKPRRSAWCPRQECGQKPTTEIPLAGPECHMYYFQLNFQLAASTLRYHFEVSMP